MKETQIEWLVDKKIILIKTYHWNSDSLHDDIVRVNEMVNTSDAPLVHTVWDFIEMESYPTNLQKIGQSIRPLFINPRLGWVLTVIHNPMITFLAQVGSGMYRVRYHSFKEMDEVFPFYRRAMPICQI